MTSQRWVPFLLGHPVNNCISKGVFPDSLKEAYVLPLHKGSDKDDANNYRPKYQSFPPYPKFSSVT